MKAYTPLLELFSGHLNLHLAGLTNKEPRELYAPEEYMLNIGGKRIRPLLALIACDLFDKDPRLALDSALAVELFHNFSLIHDDILDEAPLRRGQPTVHKKWGNNIALLSGDVMLVKAFQILESNSTKSFRDLYSLFSKTAIEVCEGQQMDMNFESQESVSVENYLQMITFKTAVLLGCSLKMGAIAAEIDSSEQNHLYEFGKHLGISFQLLDDLLDAFAPDAEKFGKQVGGDILANKKTFLLLKTIELANSDQKQRINNLLKSTESESKVKGMLTIYNELNISKLCEQEADKHTQIAINSLYLLKANQKKKDQLKSFALALLNRDI